MDIDRTKQLDYAKDAITQVITLSGAILAVSLTFSKDWATSASGSERVLLQVAWVAFLASILAGVLCLQILTGMANIGRGTIWDWGFRGPWLAQIVFFLGGLVMLLAFGISVVS